MVSTYVKEIFIDRIIVKRSVADSEQKNVQKKLIGHDSLAMIHWPWFIWPWFIGGTCSPKIWSLSISGATNNFYMAIQYFIDNDWYKWLLTIDNNFIIERHKLAIYSGNKKSKKSFSHLWSKSSCEVCYSKLMIFWDEIQFIFDSKKPSRYETTVRSSQSEDGVAPSRYGNWSSWWTEQSNCLQ